MSSRRLSSSASPSSSSSSPHHPHHHDNQTKAQTSTMPLLLGLTPMVFSFLVGNGQAAAEFLFFLLAMFWLYFSAKVPWDLYFRYQSPVAAGRAEAGKIMFRMQALMLIFACAFPVLGGLGLYQFKEIFPNYSLLISEFNISLFILVALIKPSQEIAKLFHDHANQLHQELAFPSEDLDHLCQRIERLENELFMMRDTIATQEELIGVQEVMKPALSKILETIKESKQREEQNSTQANKKIKELESKLGTLEPALKKKPGVLSSVLDLPMNLLLSIKSLLLSPFIWSSPREPRRDRPEDSRYQASSPSSKRFPSEKSKKSMGEYSDGDVPLKLQRRRDLRDPVS